MSENGFIEGVIAGRQECEKEKKILTRKTIKLMGYRSISKSEAEELVSERDVVLLPVTTEYIDDRVEHARINRLGSPMTKQDEKRLRRRLGRNDYVEVDIAMNGYYQVIDRDMGTVQPQVSSDAFVSMVEAAIDEGILG